MLIATILLDSLAYGMVLFLVSSGLAITMGLMRIINLAHGAFAMIGGYLGAVLGAHLGVPFFAILPLVFLGCGLLGAVAERVLYRPLYGKPELSQVLMTIGLTFVVIAALTVNFGAGGISAGFPAWLEGSTDLGFREYPTYRLFLIVFGVIVGVAVWLSLDRSRFGHMVRAAVDDRHMARTLGLNVSMLFMLCFALACGLAGVGGYVGAGLLQLEPNYPLRYLSVFLIIVAIGGVGSLRGALIAALGFALIETTGRYLVPSISAYLPMLIAMGLLLALPHGLGKAHSK